MRAAFGASVARHRARASGGERDARRCSAVRSASGWPMGALRLLVALRPANLPRLDEIGIDASVLLFTLAVSLVCGRALRPDPDVEVRRGRSFASALRDGGRTRAQSRERHRARNALVVVQVALALVLLVSSGLMIRTFQALRKVQPGFTQPEEIQTLRMSIPDSAGARSRTPWSRMQQAIQEKIAAMPGCDSRRRSPARSRWTAGAARPDLRRRPRLRRRPDPADPALQVRLPRPVQDAREPARRRARLHLVRRSTRRVPVVMVSENLARELWGSPRRAIGKRMRESHEERVARGGRRRGRRAGRRCRPEGAGDRLLARS